MAVDLDGDVFSILEAPKEVRQAAEVAHRLMSECLAEEEAGTLSVNSVSRIAPLVKALAEVPSGWVAVPVVQSFLAAPMTDQGVPDSRVVRRADAMLEVLATPYCALDVDATSRSVVEEFRQAQHGKLYSTGVLASSFADGAALGVFGFFGASSWAAKAEEFADRRLARHSDFLLDLAQLVTIALAIDEDSVQQNAMEAALLSLRALQGELSRSTVYAMEAEQRGTRSGIPLSAQDLIKRGRVLTYAIRAISGDDDPPSDSSGAPDTKGQVLRDAKLLLESIGHDVKIIDASGQERGVWRETGWRVVHQEVGTRVRGPGWVELHVLKFGEPDSLAE